MKTPSLAVEFRFDDGVNSKMLNVFKTLNIIFQAMIPHFTLVVTASCSSSSSISKLQNVLSNFVASSPRHIPNCGVSTELSVNENTINLCTTQQLKLINFHRKLCEAQSREGLQIEKDYVPFSCNGMLKIAQFEYLDEVAKATGQIVPLLKLPLIGKMDQNGAGGIIA